MDLKKTFSLQWRIFIPLALLIWISIGALLAYRISLEKSIRRENLEVRLKNVNTTIIQTYEKGGDIQELVDFIEFFYDNTILDDLRISVYSSDDQLIATTPTPVLIEDNQHNLVPELREIHDDDNLNEVTSVRPSYIDNKRLMFNAMTSNDGMIQVMTATPYNITVSRYLAYDPMVWIVTAILTAVVTIALFLLCRQMSRQIYTLRDFAAKASEGNVPDIERMTFPHNEFGEVSRRIVRIYLEKDNALEQSKHEHQVAMRAVNERERVKRQMSNNINHELKTPVGIIKGYLDTINSDPDMPESLRRSFLEKAQAHAERLTQLLKDVSSITRLDDGTQQVELSEFDFHDLVYNLANDLEVSHINGSMHFHYKIPFDCMICANYTLISNALMNLVRNAANYSKGTRMDLRLIKETPTEYTFSFADDGTGVGEEHLSHLFERFYRVDEGRARKSGGTGLGLPIVKSTFTAIGGSIEVRNVNPHGLEFIFVIPKAGCAKPEHPEPEQP